ncbi:hypothetical protein PSFL111601_24120 [Pseudomonas floridensis]
MNTLTIPVTGEGFIFNLKEMLSFVPDNKWIWVVLEFLRCRHRSGWSGYA